MPPGTAASPQVTGRTWIGSGRRRHGARGGGQVYLPPPLCVFLSHALVAVQAHTSSGGKLSRAPDAQGPQRVQGRDSSHMSRATIPVGCD